VRESGGCNLTTHSQVAGTDRRSSTGGYGIQLTQNRTNLEGGDIHGFDSRPRNKNLSKRAGEESSFALPNVRSDSPLPLPRGEEGKGLGAWDQVRRRERLGPSYVVTREKVQGGD